MYLDTRGSILYSNELKNSYLLCLSMSVLKTFFWEVCWWSHESCQIFKFFKNKTFSWNFVFWSDSYHDKNYFMRTLGKVFLSLWEKQLWSLFQRNTTPDRLRIHISVNHQTMKFFVFAFSQIISGLISIRKSQFWNFMCSTFLPYGLFINHEAFLGCHWDCFKIWHRHFELLGRCHGVWFSKHCSR